ncbi:DUF91 domain-containing protein [Ornithobacterium rhinotracheale]|uniref:DUF91 domain-containing protein n=1 Tax=Ornithobacterium rhinotracheale TaxID=28251 RepID=UPI00129C80BB|nr:DUF91 domain-containing protein [Ornithobacterium rhinotracheale]MRJ11260.1 DUF91 domain-containing protein [Ornithobacterium rhinotracheale]
MAMTHVFVVDNRTLKVHLEYMFAGTGSKEDTIDFNNSTTTNLHYTSENKLCGMIADFGRIRFGDKIIFYLQAQDKNEGRFYGVFKVKSKEVFLENYSDSQYLYQELQKNLTFRIEIEADTVYAKGITEWEALDSIKGLTSPNQMLWSLIYRKLKGNRGNTMITLYESERLIHLIRTANSRKILNGDKFTFNKNEHQIETSIHTHSYKGDSSQVINILPRLLDKLKNGRAFEAHLQAYITQNIGKRTNITLDNTIIPQNSIIEWIGNEVSCGVGMQRIDICLSVYDEKTHSTIMPIELKAVEASASNLKQLQRYIDWLEQYYLPNRPSDIQPILIAKKSVNFLNESSSLWQDFLHFDKKNSILCRPISVIEYNLVNGELQFTKVK